jgi:cell division protein FtsB
MATRGYNKRMRFSFESIRKDPRVQELRDVRVLGLIVFAVLAILVAWSGANVVQTNLELQRQVNQLIQQNEITSLENTNQKLKNQYLTTDQYVELTARRQFGLGAKGETLLLVPEVVAKKYVKHATTDAAKPVPEAEIEKPFYQENLQAWADWFFHRE